MSERTQQTGLPGLLLREAKAAGLEDMLLHAPLIVGVSGGADSLALLHALCKLRGESASETLHVAHLDHGFRGEDAAEDARFVARTAERWGLPSTVRRFDVPAYAHAQRLSPETAARRVRYTFLAGVANTTGGTVTVAHNADDQAETVLMHLLRGSGTGGLAGMRPLGLVPVPVEDASLAGLLEGNCQPTLRVFRPLLSASRALVESYCLMESLEPHRDATNLDTTYRRNLVRHHVLPALEEHFPAVKAHLNDLANIAAAEDEWLEGLVEQEWQRRVTAPQVGEPLAFTVAGFTRLTLGLRRRFARRALKIVAGTLSDFSFDRIDETVSVLSGGSGSLTAADLPHGIRVTRVGDTATVCTREGTATLSISANRIDWPCVLAGETSLVGFPASIDMGAGWVLEAALRQHGTDICGPGDYLALFDWHVLQALGTPVLRTRKPGDTIQPFGMRGHKSLQDLFVDAKIPRWVRDHLAVIALPAPHSEVLWVPGPDGRRSALAPVGEHTKQVLALGFVRAGASRKL